MLSEWRFALTSLFPSRNGPFSQSQRQSSGSVVRSTIVRLRLIPWFPWSCKKCRISELETCPNSVSGWALAGGILGSKSECPPAKVGDGGQVEIRNNDRIFKIQNDINTKSIFKGKPLCPEHLGIGIPDLFRFSEFEFHISPLTGLETFWCPFKAASRWKMKANHEGIYDHLHLSSFGSIQGMIFSAGTMYIGPALEQPLK